MSGQICSIINVLHFFSVDVALGFGKTCVGFMENAAPLDVIGPCRTRFRVDEVHARPFFFCAIEKDFLAFSESFFHGVLTLKL